MPTTTSSQRRTSTAGARKLASTAGVAALVTVVITGCMSWSNLAGRTTCAPTHDAEGAACAVVHFFDAYTHSFHTGDTADLEALSGEGCDFCARAYQRASQIHEVGGRLDAGEFTIAEVEIHERPGTPWTNAQAQVEQAPIEVYDADDTLLRVDEGGQWTFTMALSYIEDEGWIVFAAMPLDS